MILYKKASIPSTVSLFSAIVKESKGGETMTLFNKKAYCLVLVTATISTAQPAVTVGFNNRTTTVVGTLGIATALASAIMAAYASKTKSAAAHNGLVAKIKHLQRVLSFNRDKEQKVALTRELHEALAQLAKRNRKKNGLIGGSIISGLASLAAIIALVRQNHQQKTTVTDATTSHDITATTPKAASELMPANLQSVDNRPTTATTPDRTLPQGNPETSVPIANALDSITETPFPQAASELVPANLQSVDNRPAPATTPDRPLPQGTPKAQTASTEGNRSRRLSSLSNALSELPPDDNSKTQSTTSELDNAGETRSNTGGSEAELDSQASSTDQSETPSKNQSGATPRSSQTPVRSPIGIQLEIPFKMLAKLFSKSKNAANSRP